MASYIPLSEALSASQNGRSRSLGVRLLPLVRREAHPVAGVVMGLGGFLMFVVVLLMIGGR